MHGLHGTPRRARITRAEFVLGAVGGIGLGVVSLATSTGTWAVIGAWLVFIGLNYIPLAFEAFRLSRPGALERELADIEDFPAEARRVGIRQLWILVPLAVVVAAIVYSSG